jgi:hypothetical protein
MSDQSDPFEPDVNVPSISNNGDPNAFTFDGNDLTAIPFEPPPPRGFPWKWIAIIGGGVLGLALIGVIIALVISRIKPGNTPQGTVANYYKALERGDYDQLKDYIDPEELTGNILPTAGKIMESLQKEVKKAIHVDIQFNMEFQNLTYSTIELQGDKAKVKVSGNVRLYKKGTIIDLKIPYSWTHDLVKKNGRWYVKP